MRRPSALTLDLDDTLLDGAGLEESIARVCISLARLYPQLDAAALRSANAEVWMQYWFEVEDDWTLGRLDSSSFSLEGWRRVLLACGCRDDDVVETARDLHRQFARDAHRLYDDVQELLDYVEEAQLPIALVSNGASDVQREKVDVLDLGDRFVTVVVSSELGAAKPDAGPFDSAVQALGSDRSRTWHVGDNLDTDVQGARNAGLVAVWVNRHGRRRAVNDPEPNIEVESLSMLVRLLRSADG
jgi:putative hydrolase of the HAD superfamily